MNTLACTVVAVALMGLASPVALAEPSPLRDLADRGQQALRSGSYAEARELFAAGIQRSQQANEPDWVAKFRFYRGNASLVEAGVASQPVALAEQATADYRAVLEARPESGAAMVNLARALALLDRQDEAQRWYRSAIALNDSRQALYRQQFADYLKERDPTQAEEQLRLLVASRPESRKAHRQLVQTYLEPRNASRLAGYLLAQVEKGEVLRAQEAALAALADPGWPARYKGELMNVIGVSLARQDIAPEEFAASDEARALRRIARTDPSLRVCIDELMKTLVRTEQPVSYSWWTADEKRAATLSDLLRSLARSHTQRGDAQRAEGLYRKAIDVSGSADPKAVLDLVDFYAARGDIDAINDVSRNYEFKLFIGKGDAYRRGDERAIYDYHRSLAAIYANQAIRSGEWGSQNDSTSAAFQLEHAYRTAMKSGSITPDPQLVDHLAQSYVVTRGADDAIDLRLQAAAQYTRNGNTLAAEKVMAPIEARTLSGTKLARYERLQRNSAPPVAPPETPDAGGSNATRPELLDAGGRNATRPELLDAGGGNATRGNLRNANIQLGGDEERKRLVRPKMVSPDSAVLDRQIEIDADATSDTREDEGP